jgi:hypothetical protein
MYVGWLIAIGGVEEEPVWATPQNRGHSSNWRITPRISGMAKWRAFCASQMRDTLICPLHALVIRRHRDPSTRQSFGEEASNPTNRDWRSSSQTCCRWRHGKVGPTRSLV